MSRAVKMDCAVDTGANIGNVGLKKIRKSTTCAGIQFLHSSFGDAVKDKKPATCFREGIEALR